MHASTDPMLHAVQPRSRLLTCVILPCRFAAAPNGQAVQAVGWKRSQRRQPAGGEVRCWGGGHQGNPLHVGRQTCSQAADGGWYSHSIMPTARLQGHHCIEPPALPSCTATLGGC